MTEGWASEPQRWVTGDGKLRWQPQIRNGPNAPCAKWRNTTPHDEYEAFTYWSLLRQKREDPPKLYRSYRRAKRIGGRKIRRDRRNYVEAVYDD